MSEVKIPFKPFFKEPMLNGVKVMTCRMGGCGAPYDTFTAFGATFILTHVMRMRLGYVLSDCWAQEGCESREHLERVWLSIHPVGGLALDQIVWAHCFRRTAL